jgi:ABC-type antimicrobial peptide transport system permease subunit
MVTRTAYANLKLNKSRNIISGISIFLTTLLLITVFSVGYGLISIQFKAIDKIYPSYHAIVRNLTYKEFESLEQHADLEKTGMRIDVGKVYQDEYNIMMLYMDNTAIAMEKLKLEQGAYPEKENEIVVSKGILDALHMDGKIGDKISIPYQIMEEDGLSRAVTKEFVISGILPTRKENQSQKIYACMISKKFAMNSMPLDKLICRATVRLKNQGHMNTDEIEIGIKSITKEFDISEQNIFFNSEYLMANYVDPAVYTGVIIIALVIVFAGVITIYGIYFVSMIHKVQEFGKLKAIGATKRQIRQIVLREGMLVAFIAIPLGVLIGYFLSRGVFYLFQNFGDYNEVSKTVSQMIRNHEVSITNLWIIMLSIVVSLMTVYISLILPMRKASKISPVEAIRFSGDNLERKKIRKGYDKVTLIGLTISNLTRNRKRTCITILTLSMTALLYIVISTILTCADPVVLAQEELAGDYEISVDSWSGDKMHPERDWKVIQQKNPLGEELRNTIINIDGVNRIQTKERLSGISSDYEEDGKPLNISISGIDETYKKKIEKGIIRGNVTYEELLKGNKIIVSKRFLYWYPEVEIGAQLHLTLYDGDKEIAKTYEIAAIGEYDQSLLPDDFLLPSSVIDNLCDNNMTYSYDIWVDQSKKVKINDELVNLIKDKENLEMKSLDEVYEMWKNTLSITSQAIYGFMLLLAGIGIMNLVNTMINSIYIRRKELGILQAVGMSKKQLNKMLLLEGMFYTIGTLILSLGVGSILSYQVFLYAKEKHMLNITTYHYPINQVLVLIAVITVIQILLTLIISHNIRKQSLVDRIRFSE